MRHWGWAVAATSVKSAGRISCTQLLFLQSKLSTLLLLTSQQILPKPLSLLPFLPFFCCRRNQKLYDSLYKTVKGEEVTLEIVLTPFVLNTQQLCVAAWPASEMYSIKTCLFLNTFWQRGITGFQFAYKSIQFYWCIVRRIYYEQLIRET